MTHLGADDHAQRKVEGEDRDQVDREPAHEVVVAHGARVGDQRERRRGVLAEEGVSLLWEMVTG